MAQQQKNLIGVAKTIQIFGQTGTGKSNRARNLSQQYSRIIIVDRLGEDYSDGIIFDDISELKAFWNSVCKGDFRLIYRPAFKDNDTLRNEIDMLAEWVLKCRNVALLIEELNIIFNGHRISESITECIFAGRKRGVELITVSQRPKGYGQEFSSQAKVIDVFGTHHADDLKYFRDIMDDEALSAIENLEEYHYVQWDRQKKLGERMRICKDDYIPAEMG